MSSTPIGRRLAIAAGLVVLVTVIAAIVTMGSPSEQREIRLDERRVSDLARISDAIDSYAERRESLPPDLATLAAQPGRDLAISDPATGEPYGYEVIGDGRYRLCAVFITDTGQYEARPALGDDWLHGRGRQCFERKLEDDSKSD
ncbi:MAG: hypothetical protein M3Q42_04150 [Pseudomonadota bacterium]|nr:hypothetical protein [Pseudomonadota bacterium]